MKLILPILLLLPAVSLCGCLGIGRALPVTVEWKADGKAPLREEADREPIAVETVKPGDKIPADLKIDIDDPRVQQALVEMINGRTSSDAQQNSPQVVSDPKQAEGPAPVVVRQPEKKAPTTIELTTSDKGTPPLPTTSQVRSLEDKSVSQSQAPVLQPTPTESQQNSPTQLSEVASPSDERVAESSPLVRQAVDATMHDRSNVNENSEQPTDAESAIRQVAAEEPARPIPAKGAWKQQLSDLIESLEDQLVLRGDSLNAAEVEHLETVLAWLYLISNDRDAALESLESSGTDKELFWKELVFAVSVLMERDDLNVDDAFYLGNHRRATIALAHLRKAQEGLGPIAMLQVNNVTLCEEVSGFGNYKPFPTRSFDPGQTTIVYCEIENYKAEKVLDSRSNGPEFESEFRSSMLISNENQQIVKQIEYKPIVDRGRNRRRDFYIHYTLGIPDDLPKGTYFLSLEVEDVKAGKTTQSPALEFRVR